MILSGKLYLFLGKKVAPNLDIKRISFFILLLFKEWSPVTFNSMFGVVDKTPINSLANVPELPKLSSKFFLECSEPSPLPYTK